MKILIVGANGRVGTKLMALLSESHTVYAGERNAEAPNAVALDLTAPLPELTEAV